MRLKTSWLFLAATILLLLSIACGSSTQLEPEGLTPPTTIAPAALSPTDTPFPTQTAAPTETSPPPTEAPEPIHLSGSGDSIADFDNPFEVAIVRIVANASSRYFGVANHGSSGKIGMLVNTTEPYDGLRPLDFTQGEHTTRFEITAVGDWTIDILPLTSARALAVPGEISGIGDDVIVLMGAGPDTATISGNSEGRYFGAFSYSQTRGLLVNTTDPYQGTVILDPETRVIEVQAVGDWKISVSD